MTMGLWNKNFVNMSNVINNKSYVLVHFVLL